LTQLHADGDMLSGIEYTVVASMADEITTPYHSTSAGCSRTSFRMTRAIRDTLANLLPMTPVIRNTFAKSHDCRSSSRT